jgi:hypothetical protein
VHSVILLFSNPMLREMLERGCSSRWVGTLNCNWWKPPNEQDRRHGCNGT